MKIDILLKRTNYISIFNETFYRYLNVSHSWTGSIKWSNKYISMPRKNSLMIIPSLNIIASNQIHEKDILSAGEEYSFHPNYFRNAAQRVFVRYCNRFPLNLLSKGEMIEIEPWVKLLDYTIIVPGNHSLKLMDTVNGICTVVPYHPNSPFMKNEISFRQGHSHYPVIPKFRIDSRIGGYSEQMIKGIPINRLRDTDITDKIYSRVRKDLLEIYQETLLQIKAQEFSANIVLDIEEQVSNVIQHLPYNLTDQLNATIKKIKLSLRQLLVNKVTMALTHGDFQYGNILVYDFEEIKYFIIDWEYSQVRNIFYDSIVIYSGARKSINISMKLKKLIGMDDKDVKAILWPLVIVDNDKSKTLIEIVLSFIAEELLLRLMEISASKFIPETFSQFLMELESVVNYCNEH